MHSLALGGQINLLDMRFRERRAIQGPDGGTLLWFAWIDRKRRYTRSVDLTASDRYELRGITPSKTGEFQT
jgi:hypothetical protein